MVDGKEVVMQVKEVDRIACENENGAVLLPISASMETCSFSGTEAAAIREFEAGCDRGALCEGIMWAVTRTLAKMVGGAAYYAGVGEVSFMPLCTSTVKFRSRPLSNSCLRGELLANIILFISDCFCCE